jgi:hypothetical protein
MATVEQYMTHARNYFKLNSTYAAAEEVRMANAVNEIVVKAHRWHWNIAAGADVALSTPTQTYTIDAADQNRVLYIQEAYLNTAGGDATPRLLVDGRDILPVTTVTARPIAAGLISGTQIRFWPAPDASYTLKWRYHKRPTVFTANSESWDVPGALDSVIKRGMIWQLAEYKDDTRAEAFKQEFYNELNQLISSERMTNQRTR